MQCNGRGVLYSINTKRDSGLVDSSGRSTVGGIAQSMMDKEERREMAEERRTNKASEQETA